MSEERQAKIRELCQRIKEVNEVLRTLIVERRALGREECIEHKGSFDGRRVRDPKGRVFEIILKDADVSIREDGSIYFDGPRYRQILIRKDGKPSEGGDTHCYAFAWDGKLFSGWSWVEEDAHDGR